MDPKDQREILLTLLKEAYNHVRHYETQRSTVSNLIVIVAAAILGFVTRDNALTRADLPLSSLLFVVGIFGIAFAAKYYERTKANADRYYKYRDKLDELFFESRGLSNVLDEAAKDTSAACPRLVEGGSLGWIKVHRLWITFHALIGCLGLILTILILFKRF